MSRNILLWDLEKNYKNKFAIKFGLNYLYGYVFVNIKKKFVMEKSFCFIIPTNLYTIIDFLIEISRLPI